MIEADQRMIVSEVLRPLYLAWQAFMGVINNRQYSMWLYQEEVIGRKGKIGKIVYGNGDSHDIISPRLREQSKLVDR